ncbi:hypothetical protein HF086_000668 [Spodoptera exigua]|uniref:SWIM-type domain-containing protein n=2 Tax=Spodoptera exigua TaxID=7107 RepID=A0A922M7X0_SPOEX|nr:hypothetical protein HF086_000668 [Spodoptera exigua]
MTAAAAKMYHELNIISTYESDAYKILANAQHNPLDRQVVYLYEQWRKQNYGNRNEQTVLQILKRKQDELGKLGIDLIILENPTICVIITPIMQRVFTKGLADEIVFIDTSGSCDQSNTCVTFIFAASNIGALPVAIILHANQTEEQYSLAFKTLKEFLENKFNKLFQPSVAMTDDSRAERNALKSVLPNTRLLLCIFHVNQAIWRWLWQTEHNVNKDDKQYIMKLFRKVMYSNTIAEAELNMSILNEDVKVATNYKLQNYLTNMWARREEWCLSYRHDIINRGHNTNNFCEASIRIFKDIILQRCKVFNMCALLDFITDTFENYHKKRLLQFANGRERKLTVSYEKFCQKSKSITQISPLDDTSYLIKEKTDVYVVDSEMGTCDCLSGKGGRYCKHVCAVELKFGITITTSLNLTEDCRQDLAKLALGDEYNPYFFQNITLDSNDVETAEKSQGNSQQQFTLPINEPDNTENNISTESSIQENYMITVDAIESEFIRIIKVLKEEPNPVNTQILKKYSSELSRLQTPSSIVSYMHDKKIRRSRKIKVQPTSISRRHQKQLPSSGRIQSGRPVKKKRAHNIAVNIDQNEHSAK